MIKIKSKSYFNTKGLNRQCERNIRRNLIRSGGYVRRVARNEFRRDDKYDPRIDEVSYKLHKDYVDISTLGERAKDGKIKYSKSIPIRRASSEEKARYSNSGNINARWYWIKHKTNAQFLRGMENLAKIKRLQDVVAGKKRKKRGKQRSTEVVMEISLKKSSKFLLEIWGRNPLTN